MVSSISYGNHQQEPINSQKQQQRLLSVHKPPSKPSKKPPTSAGPASAQPRVYNVKPIHFRELVQRLTGSASQAPPSQRLQSAAPPPIQLNSWASSAAAAPLQKSDDPQDPTAGKYPRKSTAGDAFLIGDLGMELSLSPTSCSWFSFPLLSPGPLSNFGA